MRDASYEEGEVLTRFAMEVVPRRMNPTILIVHLNLRGCQQGLSGGTRWQHIPYSG